jgi:hypothetical protein
MTTDNRVDQLPMVSAESIVAGVVDEGAKAAETEALSSYDDIIDGVAEAAGADATFEEIPGKPDIIMHWIVDAGKKAFARNALRKVVGAVAREQFTSGFEAGRNYKAAEQATEGEE